MENKDFNWREALMLLCIIIALIETSPWISAQNETCADETCLTNNFSSVNITYIAVVNATSYTPPNCSKQLDEVIALYNNLTEDYHSGVNCGTIRYQLIDNNAKLSEGLKTCNQDLGKYKVYMLGFYFLFAIILAVVTYWIYVNLKKPSQEEKHE